MISSMRQPSILALDCEMVGASHEEHDDILARVSIVDSDGCVLLDTFVRPSRKVHLATFHLH